MNSWPIVPRGEQELKQAVTPSKGSLEAVPWVFYDTMTYTTTVTTTLSFFRTTKALALSNMELAGQLPAPQYFELYYIGIDVLTPPQTEARTAISDVWQTMLGNGTAGVGSPVLTFTKSSKDYMQAPASFFHGSGGPLGGGWSTAASVSTTSGEWANNSVPDGGFPFNGSVVLQAGTSFGVRIDWPAALTLSASRDLRVNLVGTLYRSVL